MAYTSVEDVHKQSPQIDISGSTHPSQTDVAEWIDQVEATLNARLAAWGYTVPIEPLVSPLSVAILSDMVSHAVIARVLLARLYGVGDVSTSGAKEAQKYFDDKLKWLEDNGLPDAVGVTSNVWDGLVPVTESSDCRTERFTMCKEF